MKKFFTLWLTLMIVGFGFGQHMLIDNTRISQHEQLTKSAMGVQSLKNDKLNRIDNTAAGPDLVVFIDGFVKNYYTVPLAQATIEMEAMVGNIGDELTEPTNANLTVGTSYDEDVAIPVPLGSGDDVMVTFPAFTASETGEASFVVTASAADDADPDNGMDVKQLLIDEEVLSRNNDFYNGNMSIGAPGGILGDVYQVLAEDVLSSVTFYLAGATPGDIHQVVVYEFDGQPTNLIATAMDVLVTEPNIYYTATFAEEVTLAPGEYFVGIIEGAHAMRLGYTNDDYTPESSWVYYNGSWNPLEDYNFFQVHMMNLEFGEWSPPLFDIALEEVTMPSFMMPGEVEVAGVIRNLSGETLTSIDVSYTMNGGTPVSQTFNVNVGPLETYEFMFDDPLSLMDFGAYTFEVVISNPNGEEDENPDNDMITHVVNVVEDMPQKRVVGEEATGTWCGWCPRGAVWMEYMADEYPETFIGIAVHNNDPMEHDEYDAGMAPLIPGYPSGLVDRLSEAYDPSQFEAVYLEQIDEIPPAHVSLESVMLDGNELSFNVRADFVAQASNLRFNAVLKEDNVTGTTSGYNQANYYSGGGNGPMGGYEDLPNPVPASMMVYDDVARTILGGWNGSPGSLPQTVSAGQSYWYSYSVTLQSGWDVNEINIVGMLIDTDNGRILNAVESNDNTVGIFNNPYEEATFSVYPNPAVDRMTIDAPGADRIEVVNFMGQVIRQMEGTGRPVELNVGEFDAGIYFVRVSEGESTTTRKVIVN
ncbi:MAG: T9SS type A sorting domain-containing protein [bacterium]